MASEAPRDEKTTLHQQWVWSEPLILGIRPEVTCLITPQRRQLRTHRSPVPRYLDRLNARNPGRTPARGRCHPGQIPMILRRIMSSLRKQRWSDLGLELLVVVVGIFLALQADSWYQTRSEQKQLSVYLQALTDELGSSAWIRERYVGWHQRVIDGLLNTLDGLDANTMQTEGMLRLIDADLLQILGELVISRDDEYQRHVASITAPPVSAELVSYDFGPEGAVVIASVDWEAASKDPAFRQRVFQGIGAYRNLLRSHKAVLLIHEQALQELLQLGYKPSGNWLAENEEALQRRQSD